MTWAWCRQSCAYGRTGLQRAIRNGWDEWRLRLVYGATVTAVWMGLERNNTSSGKTGSSGCIPCNITGCKCGGYYNTTQLAVNI